MSFSDVPCARTTGDQGDPSRLPSSASGHVTGAGEGVFLRRSRRLYTAEEDELICEMEREFVPLDEMARRLQRSVSSVRARRHVLGLSRRRGRSSRLFTPAMDDILLAMASSGARRREIADVLGRTMRQVYSRLEVLRRRGRRGREWERDVDDDEGVSRRRGGGDPDRSWFDIRNFE